MHLFDGQPELPPALGDDFVEGSHRVRYAAGGEGIRSVGEGLARRQSEPYSSQQSETDGAMTPREHLLQFVEDAGGRVSAATSLGIPYSTLCSICNGFRGVSRDQAERMARMSGGRLDENILVWIKPTKAEKAAPSRRRHKRRAG